MENEIMEENILETQETPLESEENNQVLPENDIPDTPVVEDVPESPDNVPESEVVTDSAVLEETETETDIIEESGTTKEDGEIADEEIVYMQNGNEDFYSSLSGNDVMGDSSGTSGTTYVTNYYEIVEEQTLPLWESNISDLTSTDMLLFMIFILLLVQFIHNLFKGSHWFKG